MTLPQDLSSRFQILSEVGSGPTGKSYQAQDNQTGRAGLLKVLDTGSGVPAAERQRIKRELGKQTKITNPRLATLFECSTAEPLWLFREHVEGETLQQRLTRGPLSLTAALSITAQIAAALDELHRAGLLHRDLKPGHVVLRPSTDGNENVSVIDAGIAARIETGTVFDVIGTAAYVSPEQVLGKLVSFRSDLYALGCILFEMLTGAPPFAGDDAKATLEAHKSTPVPALNVGVPPEVNTLLTSLLAKEPRSRPFSAQQVRRALEPFLPNSSGPRRSSLPPAPPGQPMRTAPGLPAPVVAKSPSADDIEELSADELEAIEPTVVSPAPSALSTGELDPLDLEDDEDDAAKPAPGAIANAAEAVNANATAQLSPLELESMVEGSLTAVEAPAGQGEGAAAKPAPSSAERQSIRPAVAGFDVETLFDEDAAPVATESDVTRVFRPVPEDAAAALMQSAAAEAEAARDADRTVMVANPFGKGGPDKRIVAAVVGVLLILLFVSWTVLGGDDESEVAAGTEDGTAPAAAAGAINAKAPTDDEQPAAAADTPAVNRPAPQAEPEAAEAVAEPVAEPAAEPAPVAAAEPVADDPAEAEAQPAQDDEGNGREPKAARERRAGAPRPQAPPPAASGQTADQLRALARAEFQQRRYREAARYYQQAAQKSPSDAGTHAGLGASLLAAGDAKAAISAYQRAIQLAPNQSGFHAALGRAYFQLGDKARAVASYRKAVQLDPNNGVARAALGRLET